MEVEKVEVEMKTKATSGPMTCGLCNIARCNVIKAPAFKKPNKKPPEYLENGKMDQPAFERTQDSDIESFGTGSVLCCPKVA